MNTLATTSREIIEKLQEALAEEGDVFFPTGNDEKDSHFIVRTIVHQGYWAGVGTRYYFDEDMNLVRTAPRPFGVNAVATA